MAGYNSKNFREQGGETTVIGGKLKFEDGATIENFPLQALKASSLAPDASAADTLAKVNEILEKLEASGLMADE